MSDEGSWLARHYIDYVYVPGLLLVVGTAIVKREWIIYAVPLAVALGAWNIYNFRKSFCCPLGMLLLPRARDHGLLCPLPQAPLSHLLLVSATTLPSCTVLTSPLQR